MQDKEKNVKATFLPNKKMPFMYPNTDFFLLNFRNTHNTNRSAPLSQPIYTILYSFNFLLWLLLFNPLKYACLRSDIIKGMSR